MRYPKLAAVLKSILSGQAYGLAPLDVNKLVPLTNLPSQLALSGRTSLLPANTAGQRFSLVGVAATFVSPVVSNNGSNLVRLTSAGVHGLSSGTGLTATYVINATGGLVTAAVVAGGTGWVTGDLVTPHDGSGNFQGAFTVTAAAGVATALIVLTGYAGIGFAGAASAVSFVSGAIGNSLGITWSGGTVTTGLASIVGVPSTTAIDVNITYAAGLGTAAVALITTPFTLNAYPVAANTLLANGKIEVEMGATLTYGQTGIIGFALGTAAATFGTSSVAVGVASTAVQTNIQRSAIQALNATNLQVGVNEGNIGQGLTSESLNITSVNTANPFYVQLYATINTVNGWISVHRQLVDIIPQA